MYPWFRHLTKVGQTLEGVPFSALATTPPDLYDFSEGERAVEELSAAEVNLNSILEAAKTVQKIPSPIKAADFRTDHLESLIYDLKAVYSEIRHRIQAHDPSVDLLGGKVRANRDQLAPTNLKKYHCICPSTIFLQLVAQSLTNSYMNIVINYTNIESLPKARNGKQNTTNPWGDVEPLQRTLVGLSQQLKGVRVTDKSDPYYPAVSQCIMFHNEDSQLTVTSSSTRYTFLPGLSAIGRQNRQEYIRALATKCMPEVQQRIMEVENSSTYLYEHAAEQDVRDPDWKTPFDRDGTRGQVAGQGATFSPRGDYRLACLIDYCRFAMEKPPYAAKKERGGKTSRRRPYEHDSCAKWELWITVLSDSRTPTAPARYPKTAQPGDPRSST